MSASATDQVHRVHDAHGHVSGDASGDTIADCLAAMDRAQVAMMAVSTPASMGWDNRVTLRAVQQHGDRFVALARVDLRAARHLETVEILRAAGATGLRISLDDPLAAFLTAAELTPTWTHLERERVVLSMHCAPRHLAWVGQLAERYPELMILVDHLGRPDVTRSVEHPDFAGLLALSRHPNVAVKTPNAPFFSGRPAPFEDLGPFVAEVLARFGPDRVLWGSDWPHCVTTDSTYLSARQPTRALLAAEDGAAEQAVFGQNFRRIFAVEERHG